MKENPKGLQSYPNTFRIRWNNLLTRRFVRLPSSKTSWLMVLMLILFTTIVLYTFFEDYLYYMRTHLLAKIIRERRRNPWTIDRRQLTGKDRLESYIPYLDKSSYNFTILSEDPYIVLFKNFLSDEECEEFMSVAKAHLRPSGVGGSQTNDNRKAKNGSAVVSSEPNFIRTSVSWFVRDEAKKASPIIQAVDKRVDKILKQERELPEVKRYDEGSYYFSHPDFTGRFPDYFNNRVGTAVITLKKARSGGDLIFPRIRPLRQPGLNTQEIITKYKSYNLTALNSLTKELEYNKSKRLHGDVMDCENSSFRVNPDKGDMIVFYYFPPEGFCTGVFSHIFSFCFLHFFLRGDCLTFCQTGDPRGIHASCPVLMGEKWTMTYWLREYLYDDKHHDLLNALSRITKYRYGRAYHVREVPEWLLLTFKYNFRRFRNFFGGNK